MLPNVFCFFFPEQKYNFFFCFSFFFDFGVKQDFCQKQKSLSAWASYFGNYYFEFHNIIPIATWELVTFVTDTEKDSRKNPRHNNHNTSAYFQTLSLFSPYNSKRNKPPGKVKNWMIEEEKERDKRTGHAWACYRRIGWRIHPGQTVQEPAVRVNCSNFLLQRPFGIPPSPSHTAVVVSKYPVSDLQTSWTNPRTQVEVSKCTTPYIWAPSLRSFTSA